MLRSLKAHVAGVHASTRRHAPAGVQNAKSSGGGEGRRGRANFFAAKVTLTAIEKNRKSLFSFYFPICPSVFHQQNLSACRLSREPRKRVKSPSPIRARLSREVWAWSKETVVELLAHRGKKASAVQAEMHYCSKENSTEKAQVLQSVQHRIEIQPHLPS